MGNVSESTKKMSGDTADYTVKESLENNLDVGKHVDQVDIAEHPNKEISVSSNSAVSNMYKEVPSCSKKTENANNEEKAEHDKANSEESDVEDEEEDEDDDDDACFYDMDVDEMEFAPGPPKPPEISSPLEFSLDKFEIVKYLPPTHKYAKENFNSSNAFLQAYSREVKILQENLPDGIWVRGYEDNMNLFSALIAGPQNTPYEGYLFAFEIQLPDTYPKNPPKFHYLSFTQRINPNLYVEGKVCVSLLGTWPGKKANEKWTSDSSLLQVLLSIQGLILNAEPYYNEPGFEKSAGTSTGTARSRDYNQEITIKLTLSAAKMLDYPPSPWQLEITRFMKQFGPKTIARIEKWIRNDMTVEPTFPMYPIVRISAFRAAATSLNAAVQKHCSVVGL